MIGAVQSFIAHISTSSSNSRSPSTSASRSFRRRSKVYCLNRWFRLYERSMAAMFSTWQSCACCFYTFVAVAIYLVLRFPNA